jgi:hypothetical protein
MSRFPSHTIKDAPEGSRSLLQKIAEVSPTGQLTEAFAYLGLTLFTVTSSITPKRIRTPSRQHFSSGRAVRANSRVTLA